MPRILIASGRAGQRIAGSGDRPSPAALALLSGCVAAGSGRLIADDGMPLHLEELVEAAAVEAQEPPAESPADEGDGGTDLGYLDLLSVSVVPKGAEYTSAATGVRTEARSGAGEGLGLGDWETFVAEELHRKTAYPAVVPACRLECRGFLV